MTETTTRSATAVVFDMDGLKVLFHKREDFRIWSLPGGRVEDSETPKQAAVRETFEETGYQIEIECCVGEYRRPQFCDTRFVYRGRVVGGDAIERGPETVEVGWFQPDALPSNLGPMTAELIADAMQENCRPLSRTVNFPIWQIWTFKVLIGLRNIRNRFRGSL